MTFMAVFVLLPPEWLKVPKIENKTHGGRVGAVGVGFGSGWDEEVAEVWKLSS